MRLSPKGLNDPGLPHWPGRYGCVTIDVLSSHDRITRFDLFALYAACLQATVQNLRFLLRPGVIRFPQWAHVLKGAIPRILPDKSPYRAYCGRCHSGQVAPVHTRSILEKSGPAVFRCL